MRRAGFAIVALLVLAGCAPATAPSKPAPREEVPALPALGSKMPAGDAQAITAYHNKVRADVGVGPLRWSPTLATYAQQWTDHLASASCRMVHRTEHRYGENLFQGTAGYYGAVDAAKGWESEKKDWRGGVLTEANRHPVGHYTQMVWRETTELGCGQSQCDGTLIVACNYDPPGNVIGHKPY